MNKNVPSILKQIVETELKSIDIRKISYPVNKIEKEISDSSKKTLNLAGALWGENVRIIAEIKQSSSKFSNIFNKNFPFDRSRFSKYCRGVEFTKYNYCNELF